MALSRLVAALLTHNLNQPLTAILINTQALQAQLRKHAATLGDEVLETLSDLVNEERKLNETLRELRKPFSRGDIADRQVRDLNALVRDALALQNAELRAQGCTVELYLTKLALPVCVDAAQMTHALMSLIANAREALSEMATVVRRIAIRTSSVGVKSVRVEVANRGMPCDPQRCFEPFYSTKPNRLGLGLAVIKSIVDADGGEISCRESVSGETVFRIDLPRSRFAR
jgi:signal transduction histidine kinase